MKSIFLFLFAIANLGAFAQFGSGGSQGGNGRPPGGGSGGNGNVIIPPRGNNVVLYRDMKYTGMSRALASGSFNASQLGFLGGNVSSIYVPPGYAVRVYDSRGNMTTLTTSVANLAQYGWDNRIASGLIQRTSGGIGGGNGLRPPISPPRPPVPPPAARPVAYLYKDSKFRGGAIPCGVGRIGNLRLCGDRSVSSIQLAQGYAIRVFTGLNLTGYYHTFTGSVVNLQPLGWNDLIRSVQVIRL